MKINLEAFNFPSDRKSHLAKFYSVSSGEGGEGGNRLGRVKGVEA